MSVMASGKHQNNKIKRLPQAVVRDVQLKNYARKLANLPQIKVKIRTSILCQSQFESTGNRRCGCQCRSTGFMAGREII